MSVIGESPRITKRDLAIKIIGATNPDEPETPEHAARKTQLASDLHYLIHAGHVLEFADGRLDLPLAPTPPSGKGGAANPEAEDLTEEDSEEASEEPFTPEAAIETVEADQTVDAVEAVTAPETVATVESSAMETEPETAPASLPREPETPQENA